MDVCVCVCGGALIGAARPGTLFLFCIGALLFFPFIPLLSLADVFIHQCVSPFSSIFPSCRSVGGAFAAAAIASAVEPVGPAATAAAAAATERKRGGNG